MNILCHIFWIPILHVLNASTMVKHINVTTPEGNAIVELSDYCITPSNDYSFKFEAMASDYISKVLITDVGITGPVYLIVIGARANQRCSIRRWIERSKGNLVESDVIDNLLKSFEYRPFWISWKFGLIEFGRGLSIRNTSSRLMVWPDRKPLHITGFLLSSEQESSFVVHYPTGNTVKYTKASGKRGAPVLSNIFGHHVVECAVRCRLEPACINFNFKESSKMCELLQARPSEATDDSVYNFYSQF